MNLIAEPIIAHIDKVEPVSSQAFPSCFITGTDTDAGKTIATASLLRFLGRSGGKAAGLKPIASGFDHCEVDNRLKNLDIERLRLASNVELAESLVNQYAFEAAIAPHVAAAHEGVEIDFDRIQVAVSESCSIAETILVEGVGGWRVPLALPDGLDKSTQNNLDSKRDCMGGDKTIAALAKYLNLPVILVVGMRLGCLNHALLTAQAILDDGRPLLGWIANAVDPDFAFAQDNLSTLKASIPAPLLFEIPYLADASLVESYVPENVVLDGLF